MSDGGAMGLLKFMIHVIQNEPPCIPIGCYKRIIWIDGIKKSYNSLLTLWIVYLIPSSRNRRRYICLSKKGTGA